jgi:polyhydroxybutyrate depolymerase
MHRGIRAVATASAVALALVACSDEGGADDDAAADGTTSTEAPEPDVAASEGCGLQPDVDLMGSEALGDATATFAAPGVDGGAVERTYRIAVPADYDPEVPVPLVLNLHGSGSNALQATAYSDLARAGTERGMIVVAPDALDGQWELLPVGADGEFLDALLADVASRYCVDEDRVHGVGMSLGAWRTAAQACGFPGRIASIALVTVEVPAQECEPMPVVAFHGTDDIVVAYGEGGGTVDPGASVNAGLPGTLENMDGWAAFGGCDPEATVTPIEDDVTRHVWDGCDDGVGVELYTIIGGGHTWPGAALVIGPPEQTTDTIDATELALDWFEGHPRTQP